MTKKISIKTKSLYLGTYINDNESESWLLFIAGSNITDSERMRHLKLVYKSEYGVKLDTSDIHGIFEIRSEYDYVGKKFHKILIY